VYTQYLWPISPISPISPMQCFYRPVLAVLGCTDAKVAKRLLH